VSALLEALDEAESKKKGETVKKTVEVTVEEPEGLDECIKSLFPHMDRAEAVAAFRRAVVEIVNEEESDSDM
jgi:hypothetical protein